MNTQTKKWTPEEIRFQIEHNDPWLYRGLMAIYNRQTEDEKSSEITQHENNVGFNGPDSNIMTRYAKRYQRFAMLYGPEKADCRKRLLKYCKQLCKIANKVL